MKAALERYIYKLDMTDLWTCQKAIKHTNMPTPWGIVMTKDKKRGIADPSMLQNEFGYKPDNDIGIKPSPPLPKRFIAGYNGG